MCQVTISEQELCALLATEKSAVAFFEAIRWPHGRICTACQSDQTKPKPSRPFFYICTTCRKHFSAKFGTVLQDSPLPARTWLYAMYKVVVARKGVSSLQLSKEVGLTPKATWHLVHRLKEACRGPVHTNGIESVWAVFKRSVKGIHHHVSRKHLPRSLAEATFRLSDGRVSQHVLDRMTALCRQCVNVHLPYAVLTGKYKNRSRRAT